MGVLLPQENRADFGILRERDHHSDCLSKTLEAVSSNCHNFTPRIPRLVHDRYDPLMLQYDFENSVGCWLTLTSQAIRREMANELAREDITSRQWEVLCWVAMEGELSQTELSERIGIEAPTLVGILDRMERDGWLERFACPKDRRRKRMRVTPKAEMVWERIVAVKMQRVRSLPLLRGCRRKSCNFCGSCASGFARMLNLRARKRSRIAAVTSMIRRRT